jgi:hypothetical protein
MRFYYISLDLYLYLSNSFHALLILHSLEIGYTPNCCLYIHQFYLHIGRSTTYQLHDISPLFRVQPVDLIRRHLEYLYQDILFISFISKTSEG